MNIAVILSGCGNRDGSELQESLSLLLALDRRGWNVQCFAPCGFFDVVSHTDGFETGEQRDILEEAARIARGNIRDLTEYEAEAFDALCLPGGMGAARNLSTYAFDGENMQVLPEVQNAIIETHSLNHPICAMCIAPMVLAAVLGPYDVRITLGGPCAAADVAKKLGADVMNCGPTEVCVDAANKVLTTPAYMVESRISNIFDGAENMVQALESMLLA